MSDNVSTRVYTCYSPCCDGGVKGVDKVPKPHGEGAVCWVCESDHYTWPRFGASDEYVHDRKDIKLAPKQIFMTGGSWQQVLEGMTITRAEGQHD